MKGAVAATAAALCIANSTPAGAQDVAPVGTTQSMDIAVTRYVIDANGRPTGMPAQTIRYRLSRLKTGAGWKTTVTLGTPAGVSKDEQARNRYFGGRVEFDSAGRFEMFDRNGVVIDRPARMPIPDLPLPKPEWLPIVDGTSDEARHARVVEIESRFGKRSGAVRGLAQYLRREGDAVEELLFDEGRGVPVELNVMQAGRLTARVSFDYVERGREIVRRAIRSEAILNDAGERAITATEVSNIVVDRER